MRTKEKKRLLLKRKEIVEHPFGTIKRNLGFTYFLCRGIEAVQAEFSFICFTYNFKRLLKIKKFDEIMKIFKERVKGLAENIFFCIARRIFSVFLAIFANLNEKFLKFT